MRAVLRCFQQSILARFLLVCFLAGVVRLAAIDAQSFWSDEVLTLKISPQPWSEMIASLKTDESCKPPFYYAIMHFWLGNNPDEARARIPSAIFGALSCGVMLLVGEDLFGAKRGWIPAALLAASPFDLWYSQEARMYSLWLLFDLAALYFYLRYRRGPRATWLVLFTLSAVLSCYTFTYGFFLLAWIGFAAVADARAFTTRSLKKFIAASLLCLLLFLPWLWQMMHLASVSDYGQFNKGSAWIACTYTFFVLPYGLTLGPTQEELRLLGVGFFRQHPGQAAWIALLVAAVLFLLVLGIKSIHKDRHLLVLTLGGLTIFWIGPAVISVLRPNVTYNPRYALVALAPLFLLLSAGLSSVAKMRPAFICLIILSVGFVMSDVNYFFTAKYQRDDLRAATAYIIKKNCSLAMVSATFASPVVDYYGRGRLTALPYPPKHHDIEELVPGQPLWQQLETTDRFAWVYTRPDHWDRQGRFLLWLAKNFNVLETGHWTGVTVFICAPRRTGSSLPPGSGS